ncbi:hypothetical protein ML5_1403 [Micromonospora sp. L5]|uniref:DUF3854 domain-containing protein n=1 Tax=Micromonospora sp. (strain L5) TaxID=648999 RepID=UPI0001C46A36|nr:DUF3854 domain-containing protein [Micromonospora sp. L5]ADU06941.1 hypothetical protein ML5_1403 [Micromonospora sp. L5]
MPEPYLSDEHRAYLEAHAVDPDQALAAGRVRSLLTRDDLAQIPSEWQAGIGRYIPENGGLLFVWTGPTGSVNVQLRPDDDKRPLGNDGEPMKYVYQGGRPPVLWAVREVENPVGVILAEGSKQCLVAARYAPEGYSVYGLAGCWGFSDDGVAIPDLEVVDGLPVKVILDADFSTNLLVWSAADRLQAALKAEGAGLIEWVRLPAGGKAGLDDYLAKRAHDRRARVLGNLLSEATAKFPAKPNAKVQKKAAPKKPPVAGDGRKTIVVNQDRKVVKDELTAAMVGMFSGTELFNHGQVLSRYSDGWMTQLDRGAFNDVSSEAALMVSDDGDGGYVPGWADPNVMSAVLSKASEFAPLDRISRAPFVRSDGSICATRGYDEASRTMLALDPGLEGLEIPEEPTRDQIEAARVLLMDEMMGGFPMDDASRANALALMITPAIRGMVPTAPLAVIDGRRKGVGKGKLASCLALIHTGEDPELGTSFPDNDEEMRKQITSTLREGRDLVFLDEAHKLRGAPLAALLTSSTWRDRILGASKNEALPNRATWAALGNEVQVGDDIDRRVYRIAIGLAPGYLRPEDRPVSSFRHPDLEGWVRRNRRELLAAVLVLVRAWFAAGQPCERDCSFQSFDKWERVVGGVLEVAGVKGFLDGRKAWRQESDHDQQAWDAHFFWLRETFGTNSFTAREVMEKARANLAAFSGPPNWSDPNKEGFTERIGYLYRSHRASETLGLVLVKAGKRHNSVNAYAVVSESSFFEEPGVVAPGGDGGDGGDASTSIPLEKAVSGGVTEPSQQNKKRSRMGNGGGSSAPVAPITPTLAPAPAPAPCPEADDWDHMPDFCPKCMAYQRARRA